MKIDHGITILECSMECFKLGIRWTDFIFDTDGDSFTNILAMCDCKPWNFDIGGEKEGDANNPNAVKICFKQNLTEAESDATRNALFAIFEKAHARYGITHGLTQKSIVFHLTNEVLFPRKISGFVIGKQGQTLWGIKQKSGVDLLLVDDLRGSGANEPPPTGFDRLIIKGSSVKSVREARENIKDLLKIANNISRGIGSGSTLGNIFHQMDENSTNAESTNEEPLIRSSSGESMVQDPKLAVSMKKRRIENGMSAAEPSSSLHNCIVAFKKQVQEIEVAEKHLTDKSRCLEHENRQLMAQISDLKSKLDKAERMCTIKNRHIDMQIKEKDMQRFKEQCLECKQAEKDTVFADCGHFLYCYACAEMFSKCKVCKKSVSNKVHIDRDTGSLA